MPSPKGYSAVQIALHWTVAVLVLSQFLLGDAIGAAFRSVMRGTAPAFDWAVWGHIAGGIAILLLVMWRLSVRSSRGAPDVPADTPPAVRTAALVSHWALYALLILLPLSGLIAWFGAVGPAGQFHELMTTALLVLAGLHVAAALWHQFWLRDRLLLRMMRPDPSTPGRETP